MAQLGTTAAAYAAYFGLGPAARSLLLLGRVGAGVEGRVFAEFLGTGRVRLRSVERLLVRCAPFLIAATSAMLAWLHARRFLPFFADDGFISLRYAERFLAGDGLTWTNGERVEGYSNLLWVLGCAALGALGLDLVTAARVLGFSSTLGTIACLAVHFRPRTSPVDALPGIIACGVMATSGTVAVWSMGGLEQPLLALLVTAGYLAVFRVLERRANEKRELCLAGLLLGLGCLTRPDAAIWVAAPLVALVASDPSRQGAFRTLRLALWAGVFPAAQLVFRLAYYDDWVPNTARAKIAFTSERLKTGTEYVNTLFASGLPLVALGAVAFGVCLVDKRVRLRVGMLGLALLAWFSYVRVIGGDIFPAFRHAAVAVPIVALAIGEGCSSLLRSDRKVALLASIIGLVMLNGYYRLQKASPDINRAHDERWEWDAAVVGPFLQRHFGERGALLGVEAAGALPYFSKLPALDLLGLSDRVLARERPKDFGKGFIGHELGSGRYVRKRAPDLLMFQVPTGAREPAYRSGQELVKTAWFREEYELVRFAIEEPGALEALVWVRKSGRAVGSQRSGAPVRVPALLFGASGERTVREDARGRFFVQARRGARAQATAVILERGVYRAELDYADAPPIITLTSRDGKGQPSGAGGSPTVTCGAERCLIDVALEPLGDGASRVFEVRFVRER